MATPRKKRGKPASLPRWRTLMPLARQASTETVGQPRPRSRRLEPVMLAAAYGAKAGSWPALTAKTMSTAYSGKTARRATTVNASARGMSSGHSKGSAYDGQPIEERRYFNRDAQYAEMYQRRRHCGQERQGNCKAGRHSASETVAKHDPPGGSCSGLWGPAAPLGPVAAALVPRFALLPAPTPR